MAKNITLMGADYPDVPAVQLPQTGGGTATFYDIQVIDNLNSDSSTDALSAKQGKQLDTKINNKDYFTLINAESITSTARTVTLYNGRNLDDYKYALAVVKRGSYYRASMLLPVPLFSASGNFSLTEVDSVNTQRWYEIKFVSSTSVTIQASSNVSDAEIWLYGINKI